MTKETQALIVGLVEEAIKDAPGLINEFKAIFAVANPTTANWAAFKAKVASESYEQYVPDTALPKVP